MIVNLESDLKSKLKYQELKCEKLLQENFSLKAVLKEYKKKYTNLYDFNPAIIFTINNNYIIKNLNFKAAFLLGIDRKLLLNNSFLNYVTLHSRNALEKSLTLLLERNFKQTCQIEILKKRGIKKHVVLECSLIKDGLIQLCLTDISSMVELEQQNVDLKKSFNLINDLYQGANDAIAALDNETNVKIVNEAFNELFSKIVAIKVNVGMNLIKILDDFPELQSKIINGCQLALKDIQTIVNIENPIKNIDLFYCYELCITSSYNHDHKKKELIFRIKNLTEYKLEERVQHRWQSELTLSCRTSAMGEMASALAHEINQPLTAIAAYSRSCLFIMNQKSTDIKRVKKLLAPLEKIAVQAELAGEIIHNMKNLMREGNFYIEDTNINVLIKDTLSILHYELLDYKLKITLNLIENPPIVMTNKIHIMQVLLNLARNSIEAFRNSSTIHPELLIETTISCHYISIHIRDNGPGIPQEYRNKILNTYFTTKPRGAGIGLGICRTLIEEHGGKLCLQQQIKGAWFTFTLPIKPIIQGYHEEK